MHLLALLVSEMECKLESTTYNFMTSVSILLRGDDIFFFMSLGPCVVLGPGLV